MRYSDWMSYVKDDVTVPKLVIPGAHNAGAYAMHRFGRCQDDDIFTQLMCGIRHFCIRIDTGRKGELRICHGITKGVPLKEIFEDFRRFLEQYDDFFILDLRNYYDQKIGPFTLRFPADPHKVDALIERYLAPERYALTDFGSIDDLTVGDIRKSGKRYLIVNYNAEYRYSVAVPTLLAWDKAIYGALPHRFATKALTMFDRYNGKGLFWFQTQQTPNFGTEIGFVNPAKLDEMGRRHFGDLIDGIARNPDYLGKVNVVSGDFMTRDENKVKSILRLNLLKGNIKEESVEIFKEILQ